MTPSQEPVGKATPEEFAQLQRLRDEIARGTVDIGKLECLKARYLNRICMCEEEAGAVLSGIAQREGIPDGVDWHLSPDNQIKLEKDPKEM